MRQSGGVIDPSRSRVTGPHWAVHSLWQSRLAFESGASRQSGVKVEDVCVGGTGMLADDRDQ